MSCAKRLIPTFNPLARMIAWEQGVLNIDETAKLFRHLVGNGWAWTLQCCHGRTAFSLIQAGLVKAGERHVPA